MRFSNKFKIFINNWRTKFTNTDYAKLNERIPGPSLFNVSSSFPMHWKVGKVALYSLQKYSWKQLCFIFRADVTSCRMSMQYFRTSSNESLGGWRFHERMIKVGEKLRNSVLNLIFFFKFAKILQIFLAQADFLQLLFIKTCNLVNYL